MNEPNRFAFGSHGKGVLRIWHDRLDYERPRLFGKPDAAVIPFDSVVAFLADSQFGVRSVKVGFNGGKSVSFEAVADADEIVATLRARMNEWRRLRGEPNKYFFFGTFGPGEFWLGAEGVEFDSPAMFGKPTRSYIPFETITGFFADAPPIGDVTKIVRVTVGGGDVVVFGAVDRLDADEFVEALRTRLAEQAERTASRASDADELERLAALFDRGLLSEREFAAAKQKLLGM